MKIVYCIDTVTRLGGIEIVTIAKANALAQIPGNQVWLALANNDHSVITRLKNVSILDLAVHYNENDDKGGYLHAMLDYMKKRRLHRKRLEPLLNDIRPDIVISTGMSAKKFLPTLKIKSNPVFIREVHFFRLYRSKQAHSIHEWVAAKIGELRDYGVTIRRYDKIVVLTDAEKVGPWANWDKVVTIPNPIPNREKAHSTCTHKVAITAGRLMWVKNLEALVNIWAKVIQRHPDWTLQIWGEGDMKRNIEEQIGRLGLKEHVFLMGYTSEVQEKMAEASIFVMTSRTEGFSLVTTEAMSVGIPTVAYNCLGGISHVVKDGVTGFLVPMNDEDAFVEKVCALIEDEERRVEMGQAALREAEQYGIEKITQRWMELFHELLTKKENK